jgi:hypothetical protein
MLRFFRSSNSIVLIAILLAGMATWAHVPGDVAVTLPVEHGTFMYHALTRWLANMPGLQAWLGMALFLLAAILLIFTNNRLHLIDKISYLPALCYILLIGGVPKIHMFNPAVIAAILLIAGFIILVRSFESERVAYSYFTAPVFISAATFFYRYMYVYMLAVWIIIALWRPGYWREWVFSILGFALPLFFAFSWFFLVDDDYTRMGAFFEEIFSIQQVAPSLSIPAVVFFASGIVVVVITFGHMWRYLGSKKIIIRNGYYILILFAIITIGLIAVVPGIIPMAWYLLAFPMSFIISTCLATVKSVRWGTIMLSVLFAGVMAAQVVFLSTR